MSQRKILKTKYSPITGQSFESVSQKAVTLHKQKDTTTQKQNSSALSAHFTQTVHTKHVYTAKNDKIAVSINNKDANQKNKDNNIVNNTNNDAYIDSEKIKQEQLLRAKHQKQKTKSLKQMRAMKETQRTY